MSSASSPVRETLEAFVAGRAKAERVVAVVASEYYRKGGTGKREALRPLVEVIERAAPGVVQLAGTQDGPGFQVRSAERPFPPGFEGELKRAAAAVLASGRTWDSTGAGNGEQAGLLSRLLGAVRRWFSASA